MNRVLFCIGINQNFMNATAEEGKQVWQAFSQMMQGIDELPGVTILGIMADVPDYETVVAACNFFRTIPVGDGTYKLWKYARVEARIGRELVVPE